MLAVKTALQATAAANHLQGTLFLANKLRGLSVRIATSLQEPRTRGLDHPALAGHRGLKELRGPPLSSAAPQRPASQGPAALGDAPVARTQHPVQPWCGQGDRCVPGGRRTLASRRMRLCAGSAGVVARPLTHPLCARPCFSETLDYRLGRRAGRLHREGCYRGGGQGTQHTGSHPRNVAGPARGLGRGCRHFCLLPVRETGLLPSAGGGRGPRWTPRSARKTDATSQGHQPGRQHAAERASPG